MCVCVGGGVVLWDHGSFCVDSVLSVHSPYVNCSKYIELQVRGSTEDNSEIFFLISQRKHMSQ